MVTFIKEYEHLLPYPQGDYSRYYYFYTDDEEDIPVPVHKWYGISVQNQNCNNERECVLRFMDDVFRMVINEYDDGTYWIVNQEGNDMKWLPPFSKDVPLPYLRKLFKQHKIPNAYIGAFTASKEDLLTDLSKDIVSYPHLLSYMDIDLSLSTTPIIIHISDHLCVDVISTDLSIIERTAKLPFPGTYELVRYWGKRDR